MGVSTSSPGKVVDVTSVSQSPKEYASLSGGPNASQSPKEYSSVKETPVNIMWEVRTLKALAGVLRLPASKGLDELLDHARALMVEYNKLGGKM